MTERRNLISTADKVQIVLVSVTGDTPIRTGSQTPRPMQCITHC